jgi:hypothetical protein
MKKLSKNDMKIVKGGIGPVYYCRRTTDCPSYCAFGEPGPDVAYYCAGRVCQLAICP